MTRFRNSITVFGVVALLVVSAVAPMLSLGVGTAAATGSPGGMVGVPDSNVQDIRSDGIERTVTESDLEGAVVVSDHAATTEVSLVSAAQANEVARGASPSDVAFEAVCGSPAAGKNPVLDCDQSMALVISDEQHHDGRRVAVRTSVVREALGYVPESLTVANNETGEQWRAPARVEGEWLVASVEHFSSNAVTFGGTVELDGSPATDGAQYQYELQNLSAASDPQGTLTGVKTTEHESVSKSGVRQDGSITVQTAGTQAPTNGEVELSNLRKDYKETHGNRARLSPGGSTSWTEDVSEQDSVDKIVGHVAGNGNNDIDSEVEAYVDGTYIGTATVAAKSSIQTVTWDSSSVNLSDKDSVTIKFVETSNAEYQLTFLDDDPVDGEPYIELHGNAPSEVTVSHGGTSETVAPPATVDVSLELGEETVSVSPDWGTVDATVSWTEISESEDVAVELNGEEIGSATSLADGETANFSASTTVLQNGTNTINISVGDGSLSTDAPTPEVGFSYSHSAQFDQSTDYVGEKFTERYNVSRAWNAPTTNATLAIPFDGHVVAMRSLTVYQNGTEVPPSWSRFRENSTTLEVGFGNVDPGTTTRVVANGSKVETAGLTLQVLEPSAPGERLESRIELSNVGSDANIDVGPTVEGQRIHHLTEESWTASEYVVLDTTGAQKLYVPEASEGSTATVTYVDTSANATKGDVRISVEETGSSPQFRVRPGPGGGGDTVEFTYYQTTTGTTYYLKALEGGEWTLVDSAVAQSPVTLSASDSDQVLSIFEGSAASNTNPDNPRDSETEGSGTGGISLGSSLFVVLAVVLLALSWFVSQEYGSGRISTRTFLYLSAGVIVVFGLELLSGSLVQGLISVLASFFGGATEAWPLIVLVGGGLAYYYLQLRDTEAQTPDEQTTVQVLGREK